MPKTSSIVQWGTPPLTYYKDILMRANPQLHQEAFEVLQSICPPGQTIIDVGAGQGAFSARLADNGYLVTAIDKNSDDFRASGVQFESVDFDSPESVVAFLNNNRGRYDVAVGMEVIEHVENPWEYFRTLLSLVKPGGYVLITTPNVESAQSRIRFLFSGLFEHFSIDDYRGSGHINPLTFHEMELIARGIGVEIVSLSSLCPNPWIVLSRRVSTVLMTLVSSVFRPFLGKTAGGDILCMVLRKPRTAPAE